MSPVEWVEKKASKLLLKTSFHCLLSFTFVTFLIHWPLSPAAFGVSWCWSCCFCTGLIHEIYSGVDPSAYVYCLVCYRMIVAPYVRSVVMSLHVVKTLDDELEHPMKCELSLLPKGFPCMSAFWTLKSSRWTKKSSMICMLHPLTPTCICITYHITRNTPRLVVLTINCYEYLFMIIRDTQPTFCSTTPRYILFLFCKTNYNSRKIEAPSLPLPENHWMDILNYIIQ